VNNPIRAIAFAIHPMNNIYKPPFFSPDWTQPAQGKRVEKKGCKEVKCRYI
jgi:hypothetical protein